MKVTIGKESFHLKKAEKKKEEQLGMWLSGKGLA